MYFSYFVRSLKRTLKFVTLSLPDFKEHESLLFVSLEMDLGCKQSEADILIWQSGLAKYYLTGLPSPESLELLGTILLISFKEKT